MHRVPRAVSVVLLVALAASTMLAACRPAETPAKPSQSAETHPSEWTVVVAEATGGADPLTEYGTNSQFSLIPHVLEPLMRAELLPDGKAWGIVNDLAERWSFPEPTILRVELKKGVKFHNGEELTAEHVKYAYDNIVFIPQPGRRAATLKALGEVEIVDQYTVEWHLSVPNRSAHRFRSISIVANASALMPSLSAAPED